MEYTFGGILGANQSVGDQIIEQGFEALRELRIGEGSSIAPDLAARVVDVLLSAEEKRAAN